MRDARLGLAALALLAGACGKPLDLPQEPDATGIPQGEIAYVLKYEPWQGLGRLSDLVLTSGLVLYGAVEDSGRVYSWLSDTQVPRLNPGRSIPAITTVDGDTLSQPVRICEGRNKTLWVAYAAPHPRLVQWDINAVPPVRVAGGIVRDDSIGTFGGIAADPDSDFVFVADATHSRIRKYAPSATGGARVATLATQGNGDHFLQEPHGLFCFGDSLLVADTGKHWIQVLSADVPFSGRGQLRGPEDDRLQVIAPLDVWVDEQGYYYVADTGNARVVKLTREGVVKEVVTEFDRDPGRPGTVAASVDEAWVADPDRGRLTIFRLNTTTEELP